MGSWFDFLPESPLPGGFGLGDIASGLGGLFGGGESSSSDDSGSGLSLSGAYNALTTGLGFIKGLRDSDNAKDKYENDLKMLKENEKFKFLTELAKLKYLPQKGGGGGGGGGGSARNRNADLIEVLSAGQNDLQEALNALQTGYIGALK